MNIVVDSSVAMAWAMPDEDSARARKALRPVGADGEMWIPALWWYEVANVVATARRRRRLTEAQGVRVIEILGRLPLRLDAPPGAAAAERLARLAREHDLSAYDAAYLELAERRGLPLATFDAALARASKVAGVELVAA